MKRAISTTTLIFTLATAAPLLAAPEKVQTVPVSVTQAESKTIQLKASTPGELESPADPVIAAEVEGQILKVLVKDGDTVESGQLLATLDPEPYEIALDSAKANIARIEAVISNQRLTVKRLNNLRVKQSSAQSDLDKAKTELASSRAELTSAKANMRGARYQLNKASIRSPNNGVVQKRYISSGSYVRKADPVFQVVTTGTLTARLYIPESLTTKMHVGLPVELHAGGEQQVVKAKISRLLPALDPDNRSLSAMVDFNNQYSWRPGMSISARMTLETHDGAVMVPVRSVVRRPVGSVVYRIENNKAVAKQVETGERDGSNVEILSGLDAGDSIALDGAGFLTNGAAVEIRVQK